MIGVWMRLMHRLDLHNIRTDRYMTNRQKYFAMSVSDHQYAKWVKPVARPSEERETK